MSKRELDRPKVVEAAIGVASRSHVVLRMQIGESDLVH